MARQNIIEILLKSKDEATPNIKVLGLSLTDLKSGIDMVASGAQKAAQLMRAAFDFTEQGAAVLQTRDSFERLGLSIEEMRDRSLGTVDDMTLMSSSLTLAAGASENLQGYMLEAAPQLLEIAKAANAVNPAVGDTAFLFGSLARGIKRSSPLIIDNTGLVLKLGEANETYAETIGKTVEDLSAEEKQIALLNATLEAGDRLIEQAGGNVESYTDAWAQLRVETRNATDEMKATAAEGLGPLVAGYADNLRITREYSDEIGLLRANLGTLGDALGLTGTIFDKFRQKEEDAANIQQGMIATTARYAGLADYYASRQARITDSTLDSAEAWDQYSFAIAESQRMSDEYTTQLLQEELARAEEAAARATERFEGIKWATAQTLTEDLEGGREQLVGLRDTVGELQSKIGELEGMSYRTPAQDEELSGLRGKLSDVRGEIDGVIDGMREMSARFVLSLIEMKIAADDEITTAESLFYAGYARQMGLIDDLALAQSAMVSEVVDNMNLYGMTAEEALIKVIGQTDDLVGKFADTGTAGTTAMSDITRAGGIAGAALMGAKGDADELKAALDLLAENDITIDVHFNVDELRIPSARGAEEQGPGLIQTPRPIMQASGGDYLVNRPTPFIAGDDGLERAIFIPQGQPGFDSPLGGGAGGGIGGGGIGTLNLYVYGTADAHETARLVMQEFQGRGLMPQRPMR